MGKAEREEAYRADRGYISYNGIVICGSCFDDARYGARTVIERVRYADDEWERYNPEEGDDWCSICDRGIVGKWRDSELPDNAHGCTPIR